LAGKPRACGKSGGTKGGRGSEKNAMMAKNGSVPSWTWYRKRKEGGKPRKKKENGEN